MDDLRVALLIAGIVVVVGVYVFARFSRRHAARREDEPGSIAREPSREDGDVADRPAPRGKDGDSPGRSTPPGSRPVKRATRARRDVGDLGGMFAVRRETSGAELSVDVSILAGLRATYESTMDGTLGDGTLGDGTPGDGTPGDASEAVPDPRLRSGIPEPIPDLPPGGLSESSPDGPPGGVSESASHRLRDGEPARSPGLPADDARESAPDGPPGGASEGATGHPSDGVPERFPDHPPGDALEDTRGDSPDHPPAGDSHASPGRSVDGAPEDSRGHPSRAAAEAPRHDSLEDTPSGSAEAPPTVPPTSPPSRGAGEPLAVDMSRPLVYLTLVSKQETFSGRVVLDALDAEGFRPGLLQLYYWRSDAEPSVKFGVANMVEPGVLDPDVLPETETPGLVSFMSVPRESASAFSTLDAMVTVGRRLARRLDATLCDDTRSTLTAQAENHLREKIAEILRRDRI